MIKECTRSRTEDIVFQQYIFVDVDDNITVDVATVIATAIDVTFQQTGVSIRGSFIIRNAYEVIFRGGPFCRIPYQSLTDTCQLIVSVSCISLLRTISNEFGGAQIGMIVFLSGCKFSAISNLGKCIVPTQWHDSQITEVDFQTVLDIAAAVNILILTSFFLRTNDTTFVVSIKPLLSNNIGIVTTAHELIKDIQTAVYTEGYLARDSHTTYVTTTEEGTYVTGVLFIGCRVAIGFVVEYDSGLLSHGDTFHIIAELNRVFQVP